VSLFNCADKYAQERFHIAIAEKMYTKLHSVDEAVCIDGLHVVLEGLLMFERRVFARGRILGVLEFVCGCEPHVIKTATSLTFLACTYSSPDHLQNVLMTG
jgi:hypothetical protein